VFHSFYLGTIIITEYLIFMQNSHWMHPVAQPLTEQLSSSSKYDWFLPLDPTNRIKLLLSRSASGCVTGCIHWDVMMSRKTKTKTLIGCVSTEKAA